MIKIRRKTRVKIGQAEDKVKPGMPIMIKMLKEPQVFSGAKVIAHAKGLCDIVMLVVVALHNWYLITT